MKSEEVFFIVVFKYSVRLSLRPLVYRVLTCISRGLRQFNSNFWITLLSTITTFSVVERRGAKLRAVLALVQCDKGEMTKGLGAGELSAC